MIGKVHAGDTNDKFKHFTSMLKQIKTEKFEEDNNGDLNRDWLIIKKILKSKDEGSLKEI